MCQNRNVIPLQAEAELEALKGLLEHQIQQALATRGQGEVEEAPRGARTVARKSTGAGARTALGDRWGQQPPKFSFASSQLCCYRCRNVATKSTGPGAKFWPETRIQEPYSFYGVPPESFDPRLIKTRMAMGELAFVLLISFVEGF